jgi:hypothetical protein
MMTRPSAVLFRVLLVASAAAVAAPIASAATQMSPPTKTVTTKGYVFKLSIGMSEQMWTQAQVRAKHPTTGEVMLMGSMGGAMSMGGAARHLEVHIISRADGKVVAGAHPTITAMDTTVKNGMAIKVPVAVMEGITAGAADLHYGNNVHLITGHTYKITVTLHGERAVFHAKT